MSQQIFQNLRVLELSPGSMAASLAGMLLADNGADVRKVEPPDGDRLRWQASSGFTVWNRGKESTVLDLHSDEGRGRARQLASSADVIIEAFSPGVADRWDLGYEQLRQLNPATVYASIKAFGSTGPYARIKGYEGLVAAKAGVFTLGAFGFRPGPIFINIAMANLGAAHMTVAGITAALRVRDTTGIGQRVESTLLQGLSPFDYHRPMEWQYMQRHLGVSADRGDAASCNRYSFKGCSKDGRWFIICTMLPHELRGLLRACNLEELLADPRFAEAPTFRTADDAQALEDQISQAFRHRTADEWMTKLASEPDVPFELARTTEEALEHPQVVHNGHVISVDDPRVGPIRQIGPIANFRRTPSVVSKSAPALDEQWRDFDGAPSATGSGPIPSNPLQGVTIVEAGFFYATPYSVTMAAALGARVIKLESPKGDPLRYAFGPEVGTVKTMEGKESLAIDLLTAEGQEIVHKMVARANAVVFGFRPVAAKRMGLDEETVRRINPNAICLHSAGYGVDGPSSTRPMYAETASAIAGSFNRLAGYWMNPELSEGWGIEEIKVILGERIRGFGEGDASSAVAGLSALSLALYAQHRGTEGQFVSTSMINGNLYAFSDDFNSFTDKEPVATPDPDLYGLHALYRLYPAASGWIFLAVPTQKEWESFVSARSGGPKLAGDHRFTSLEARRANDVDLVATLSELALTRSAGDWEELLSLHDVGCAAVYERSPAEFTCTDPVLRSTGHVVEVEHPIFGKVLRHGPPVHLSETPCRIAPGCRLGQHTEAIVRELGYTSEEIADLKDRKIIFFDDVAASND